MDSYLIVGGTREDRNESATSLLADWKVAPFDVVSLTSDTPSIGIMQVREFERQLALAPVSSPFHVGLIAEAERLTVPAQHAMLKTLEEPPVHGRIIIEEGNPSVLLPTILSRCHIIRLDEVRRHTTQDIERCREKLSALVSSPVGKKMLLVEEVAQSKELALSFVDCAIAATREILKVQYQNGRQHEAFTKPQDLIRRLLTARLQLINNAHPKLILDNLFILL